VRAARPSKHRARRHAERRWQAGETDVAELEANLNAIRMGEVDALVVRGKKGDQVFTLQGAEHPYRTLVEAMNEGAATLDAQGRVLYANTRFAEIFQVPLEKLIGSALQSLVEGAAAGKISSLLRDASRSSTKGEIRWRLDNGRLALVQLSLSPFEEEGLKVVCAVATEHTKLAEANEALRTSEDTLRQLSGKLMQAQDDERRRIARDLHDITGQKLASLSLTLSQTLRMSKPCSDPEVRAILNECLQNTRDVTNEIRVLSYLLHPPLLDELGLASAVHWYVRGFEPRTGIKVNVDVSKSFPRLAPDAEVTLFRIVQEALTNVHRYSGSSKAEVKVRHAEQRVKLTVRDFGRGMPTEMAKSLNARNGTLGVGVQGMRERVRQLAGTLEIWSAPGRGTLITASLPQVPDSIGPDLASEDQAQPYDLVGEIAAGPGSARQRILIADDHEVLRRGVRTILEGEDAWEICGEATNGQEAVDKTLALRPDLLILDINLPILNGVAALARIRQSRVPTKVLMFTVQESEQMMHETLDAGAQGFVSKARAGDDLVIAIKTVLSGGKFYGAKALQSASA
jgi:PAS domain S-box-containing protein